MIPEGLRQCYQHRQLHGASVNWRSETVLSTELNTWCQWYLKIWDSVINTANYMAPVLTEDLRQCYQQSLTPGANDTWRSETVLSTEPNTWRQWYLKVWDSVINTANYMAPVLTEGLRQCYQQSQLPGNDTWRFETALLTEPTTWHQWYLKVWDSVINRANYLAPMIPKGLRRRYQQSQLLGANVNFFFFFFSYACHLP